MADVLGGTALDGDARRRLAALRRLTREASTRLESVQRRMADGAGRKYIGARIKEANEVIDGLWQFDGPTQSGVLHDWARNHIPKTYGGSAAAAGRDLGRQAFSAVTGDRRIYMGAVESLLGRFATDVERDLIIPLKAETFRTARLVTGDAGFIEDIAAGIVGGLPRRETSKLLKRSILDAAGGAISDEDKPDLLRVRSGKRDMSLDTWTETYARTETCRASTAGTRTMCAVNGVEHIQITKHSHNACICTPFEGRIYSLNQKDTRFPWIGVVPNAGCPMHPNCIHREAPAIVDYLAERGQIDGRDEVPPEYLGLTDAELARKVRANREELQRYSKEPNGFMPLKGGRKKAAPPAEPERPKFVPAKTVAEARQYGARHAEQGYGLEKVKVDVLNDINEAFDTVLGLYGIRLRGSIDAQNKIPGKTSKATAVYVRVNAGLSDEILRDWIGFQGKFTKNPAADSAEVAKVFFANKERNTKRLRAAIDDPARANFRDYNMRELARVEAAPRWTFSQDSARPAFAAAAHEAGHAVYYRLKLENAWTNALQKENVTILEWFSLSEYGATNASELFAETTAAYAEGRERDVPESIRRAYDSVTKSHRKGP